MRNRGVTKKSRDYWVATNFNENFELFNEIFHATHIGGYMFLEHCSSGWGVIKFLIIKWGGHKNIAEVLSEIHDPPHPKENGGPLRKLISKGRPYSWNSNACFCSITSGQ